MVVDIIRFKSINAANETYNANSKYRSNHYAFFTNLSQINENIIKFETVIDLNLYPFSHTHFYFLKSLTPKSCELSYCIYIFW